MNISTQPAVIGQVPTVVVGIFVNNDRIGIPEPVSAVGNIVGSNRKVIAPKPETAGSSALEPPYMPRTKAAGKSAMFPGPIEVVVSIAAARVMPNPFVAVGVNVRGLRMAPHVAIVADLFLWRSSLLCCRLLPALLSRRCRGRSRPRSRGWSGTGGRRRTRVRGRATSRNVASTDTRGGTRFPTPFILCNCRNRNQEERQKKPSKSFHFHLHVCFLILYRSNTAGFTSKCVLNSMIGKVLPVAHTQIHVWNINTRLLAIFSELEK